jgi:hypothetical protein
MVKWLRRNLEWQSSLVARGEATKHSGRFNSVLDLQAANNWNFTNFVKSQQVPGTSLSHTLFKGVHLAKPKIQTRFIETVIDTIMKMSRYFIQDVVEILCKVRAKDDLLMVVAMMANVAKRIVKRLMVLRSSLGIVAMRWPKPRLTR